MSFRNPILAGNTLVRAAIESTNYTPGSVGWMIGRDGSAEFNAATFRGTVVVQSNQAVLFYSGTPAAGNLVLAIAPVAGTDSFGNGYNQGLTIGTPGGFEIVLGLTGGSPLMFFPTGRSQVTNSSALQTIVQGSGTSSYEQLQILGAQDSTQKDAVDSAWASSSADGTQPAQKLDFYHDAAGVYHFYAIMNKFGQSFPLGVTIGASATVLPVQGELFMANAAADPGTPSGGGALWAKSGGTPHWRDSGGQTLGMVRAYSAAGNATLLSNFTTEADVPGATTSIVVTGSNATLLVNAAWDMNCGGAAATMVGFFNWNGTDQTAQGIHTGSAANQRDTVSQVYRITGIAAGTYTAKLRASCTVANSLNQAGGIHTGFTALLIDQ